MNTTLPGDGVPLPTTPPVPTPTPLETEAEALDRIRRTLGFYADTLAASGDPKTAETIKSILAIKSTGLVTPNSPNALVYEILKLQQDFDVSNKEFYARLSNLMTSVVLLRDSWRP